MTEADKQSLVDWEVGLAATGGKPALLCELIDIFFSEYPEYLVGIREATDQRCGADLRRFAHTLKGCLRYFGESRAATLARELESAGGDECFDDADRLFAELCAEIERLRPELQHYIDVHQ